MNREGKKCVLYPRVSTEMQVDGYSLEGQKNSLKRFADREEMEIVGIYEDAGKSGKSIEGRPAFKKMLSDIKNGLEIEYILVYKLSRFGRNAADILNSLEFVQSYGINLICIEEGIDSSQTSGKLLISVLSAVAEIERENIIEQTMNGRREKARQGGWNGGFAPYGYYLKDNQLLIEETEAEAIRIIFDKFGNSDIGLGGVAKYLNLQGIKKIPRQNGKLETWSSHLIRQILDNPVYCGKIAYGRRTREKVKGTKNEYKQVHTDDYILEDGQHEGIVSEELWQKVHAKRKATGIKQPSKVGKDRSHLLTGVLKCPICGSSMYTNKHAWTNKDGTYKEVYYYICGRNKQERGHHCDYKASLRKIDIEPLVVEAVKELVSDAYFAMRKSLDSCCRQTDGYVSIIFDSDTSDADVKEMMKPFIPRPWDLPVSLQKRLEKTRWVTMPVILNPEGERALLFGKNQPLAYREPYTGENLFTTVARPPRGEGLYLLDANTEKMYLVRNMSPGGSARFCRGSRMIVSCERLSGPGPGHPMSFLMPMSPIKDVYGCTDSTMDGRSTRTIPKKYSGSGLHVISGFPGSPGQELKTLVWDNGAFVFPDAESYSAFADQPGRFEILDARDDCGLIAYEFEYNGRRSFFPAFQAVEH